MRAAVSRSAGPFIARAAPRDIMRREPMRRMPGLITCVLFALLKNARRKEGVDETTLRARVVAVRAKWAPAGRFARQLRFRRIGTGAVGPGIARHQYLHGRHRKAGRADRNLLGCDCSWHM